MVHLISYFKENINTIKESLSYKEKVFYGYFYNDKFLDVHEISKEEQIIIN